MDTDARRQAVDDLVRLAKPVHEAAAAVRQFPWDSEHELVTLGAPELRGVLNRYLDGEFSAQDVEDWANAVEGRDDIEFSPEEMVDFVAEIANPELFKEITPVSMRDLVQRLNE